MYVIRIFTGKRSPRTSNRKHTYDAVVVDFPQVLEEARD